MPAISEEAPRLLSKLIAERGHANVLIAGASGVGKSTLINAVFGVELAPVGQGRPTTSGILEVRGRDLPLTLFDTRGLEMARYVETAEQVRALCMRRCRDEDPNRHIHVAWLCISEQERRVHEAESKLLGILAEHVPTLVVITKARSDQGFQRVVRALMIQAVDVLRVRALAETDEEGHRLAPRGLGELVERTLSVVPEGQRRAVVAAQRVLIDRKREAALAVVKRFERLAAGAGATPIPAVGAGLLAMLQLAMRDGIHHALGVSRGLPDRVFLSALAKHGTRLGDVGKAVAGEVLKAGGILGTAPGSYLSSRAARSATRRAGRAYVEAVCGLLESAGAVREVEALRGRFVEALR